MDARIRSLLGFFALSLAYAPPASIECVWDVELDAMRMMYWL